MGNMAYQTAISKGYAGTKWLRLPVVSLGHVCPVSGETTLEEIVNSLTHGVGLLLSIAGLSVLVVLASIYGDAWQS